ncbi:hypothetical protein COLO4_18904 [Corchorus olitorius]|uniref:Tify domain-containing protein n=1 Tax=Corchorus olitorius TaxID=93759 RepID=A0A1R3J7L8_9ROSI|nr:hypothetical protein COLO4_18904 [Corchorus olitorius]
MNNFGSEVPQTSGALISANMSSQSTRNGANSSAVPSRSALSSTSNGVSVLHGNVHACNFNLQNSDLAKVVNHHMLPGTEKVKDFPIQKGDCYGANSARAANIYNINVQMPVKIPAESNSSISDQSSTILSGCPRVFCLDTGGYLLLSNTGLLGIVCSCHFSHTSVSKFCEHLGLCDINPGDAVRMESGETIAQWRKLYFEKFGIRVPEDQSGWDWPEGLLPTAGLVKFNATMPKTSSTSHLINPVGSSRGLSRCMDYTMFPKNPQLGQNSVTGLLHNKEELKDVGSSNFLFKHLIGASQNNMHDAAGGQRMEGAVSKSSTMSTIVGRDSDSGCQSMSAWIDSILKSGSSTLTHSSLQNSRMLGQICDVSAARITNDVVISDRDATSSNMELKLGQPYQQSRPAGNSALPVIAPKHLERNLGPPELCYTQRMNCHGTFRGEEESRQYCHHGADSSNPTAGRQQKKLNLGNYTFGVSSVVDATKLDKCRGDATKSFVVPPLPQLLSGESACSRGRQLNMPELGFCRLIDKGKGAGSGCVPGGLCTATDPALGIQKQVEYSRIEPGVLPVFSAVHGTDSCQSSGIPSDRIDERSCLNLPGIGNSSFVGNTGHTDQAFRRMMSSYLGSGLVSQSSPVSLGFPLATSTVIPGPTSTISQQESICLLDDSMRLLALRQILESSKQHMISSVGMSHGLGRLDQTSNPSVQHSLFELSKSREERHGPTLPSKQNVFEGASSSVPSPAARKLIPMTGK